jgi:DNA-binding XRE family transcriptional regulator
VARPQNPVSGTGPAADFARQLRLLREHAGLTLGQLAAVTGLSAATLSVAQAGRRLPSWKVCAAFVQACRGDLEDWRERWTNADNLSRVPPALQLPGAGRTMVTPTRTTRTELRPLAGPPPLPVAAETASEFMDCLLRAKIWAGDPPVRELARLTGVPPSTMQDFLRRRGKLPPMAMLVKFLSACGIDDPSVVAEWIYTWRRLKFADTDRRRRGRRGHLRSALPLG